VTCRLAPWKFQPKVIGDILKKRTRPQLRSAWQQVTPEMPAGESGGEINQEVRHEQPSEKEMPPASHARARQLGIVIHPGKASCTSSPAALRETPRISVVTNVEEPIRVNPTGGPSPESSAPISNSGQSPSEPDCPIENLLAAHQ
jgi:hypothetical protein